jgi:hypothetical protein
VVGFAVALHHLLDELQRRRLIAGLAGEGFQHLALVIDGSPEVMHLAVDLHIDLVQVPSPVGVGSHAIDTLTPDFSGEHWAEAVPPEADRLVADIYAVLVEQVFHVTKRQRVFHIHHHHEADHLGGRVEIAERIGRLGHADGLERSAYRRANFALTEPWCEFSALLLSQRPTAWSSALPISPMAALYFRANFALTEPGEITFR